MDIPEKLPPLGIQDKRLKQTNKNKTQYVLDTTIHKTKTNKTQNITQDVLDTTMHKTKTNKT